MISLSGNPPDRLSISIRNFGAFVKRLSINGQRNQFFALMLLQFVRIGFDIILYRIRSASEVFHDCLVQ